MDSLVIFHKCEDFAAPPNFDYRLQYQALPAGSVVVLIVNAETGEVEWRSRESYAVKYAIEYSKQAVGEMTSWYSTEQGEDK